MVSIVIENLKIPGIFKKGWKTHGNDVDDNLAHNSTVVQ